jgi:hypothetical protein
MQQSPQSTNYRSLSQVAGKSDAMVDLQTMIAWEADRTHGIRDLIY